MRAGKPGARPSAPRAGRRTRTRDSQALPRGAQALKKLFASVAATALLSACSSAREPERNVLLITLDTLRADRLGCYGYRAARTPNLDRLAADGVRFDRAISLVPLTLPSHTTMLTGTYPTKNGVRDNGGYTLGPQWTTLAEIAKARGYRTGAFVSAFVLDSKWGLDRGFDEYYDDFDLSRYERVSLGGVDRIAEETVEKFLPWLEQEPSGVPFFAWVHLYDPHAPYDAPEPFGSEFRDRPYDGEVAYVDAAVGRILSFLEAKGLYESTAIVVSGDHGEGLGDHDELTHGNFVYDSTVHVPLLLRVPGETSKGAVVSQQVGLIDLFPTIAELFGASVPEQSQGRSLLAVARGEDRGDRPLFLESMYPRLHYGWSEMVAVRAGRYKLIDAPEVELFDLEADPGETENVAAREPERVERMRAALEEHLEGASENSRLPAPLDPDSERRLRALGYLAGPSKASDDDVPRRQLPDPKDKIDVIQAIARADFLGASDRHDEAIALLQKVLAGDPEIVDAHLSLGNMYSATHRYEEAVEEFRACLELAPDYGLALTNLALAYKSMGRLSEAATGFARVLELDPGNRQALFNLGEVRLFQKSYRDALSYFQKGLQLDPDSPVFLRQSGVAYLYLAELDRAEAALLAAERSRSDLDSVHYTLALLYEKLERWDEAAREYEEEIRLHPDHLRALANLARLQGSLGRGSDQIRTLEDLTASHPEWAPGFIQLAKAYRDSKRPELYPRALAAVDRGLALDPESSFAPLGYFLRAELLSAAGREEEAEQAFAKGRALEGRESPR